jgi:hypothetical protein
VIGAAKAVAARANVMRQAVMQANFFMLSSFAESLSKIQIG